MPPLPRCAGRGSRPAPTLPERVLGYRCSPGGRGSRGCLGLRPASGASPSTKLGAGTHFPHRLIELGWLAAPRHHAAPRASRSSGRGKVIPFVRSSRTAAPGARLCLSPRLPGWPGRYSLGRQKNRGEAAQKKLRPSEDVRGGEGGLLFARCVPLCLSFPCLNPLGRRHQADRAFLEGRCCRALPQAEDSLCRRDRPAPEMRGPGQAAGEREELPPPALF